MLLEEGGGTELVFEHSFQLIMIQGKKEKIRGGRGNWSEYIDSQQPRRAGAQNSQKVVFLICMGMGSLGHGHACQTESGLYQDSNGKALKGVHSAVTAAEQQSIREYDSTMVILNGLEFPLQVENICWNSLFLAHISANEKDGMGWAGRCYRLCE